PDGGVHAVHAIELARGSPSGLREDRAREGTRRRTRRLASCAAERADSRRHGDRAVAADPRRWRRADRNGVRVAWHRAARGRRRVRARLSGDHGGEPDRRGNGHHGESADRHRVLFHRSTDLLPVTPVTRGASAVERLMRNRRGFVGGVAVAVMIVAGLLAPALAPHSYSAPSLRDRLQPPSRGHVLGTDGFGRDVFSRVLWGSRVSLEIGFFATAIALAAGTALGSVAGYLGGAADTGIMRAADVFLSVPALFLILV